MVFILIAATLVILIMLLTRYLVSYIWEGDKLKKISSYVLKLDIAIVILLLSQWGIRSAASSDGAISSAMLKISQLIFSGSEVFTVVSQIAIGLVMCQLLMDIALLVYIALRAIYRAIVSDVPYSPSRRRVLKYAAVLPFAAVAANVYSTCFERVNTVINRLSIPVPNLPDSLNGFKIAQISDAHIGPYMNLEQLREVFDMAIAEKPDLLAVTGDIFDDVQYNADAVSLINEYTDKVPHGVFFCYGNHEHFRNINATKKALANTNIKVLVNEHAMLGNSGEGLYIAGVDYPMDRANFEKLQESYIEKALSDIPARSPVVLLAHHPDFFDSAVPRGVALTISGHTHGGQVGFMGISFAPPVFKYMRGLYQNGDSFCYVHSGNGSWFPYRFGCPPEIAVFSLEKKA